MLPYTLANPGSEMDLKLSEKFANPAGGLGESPCNIGIGEVEIAIDKKLILLSLIITLITHPI
jgi:hypothetical protein